MSHPESRLKPSSNSLIDTLHGCHVHEKEQQEEDDQKDRSGGGAIRQYVDGVEATHPQKWHHVDVGRNYTNACSMSPHQRGALPQSQRL